MKMVEGLMNAKRPKPPAPKPSPAGFQWPNPRDGDPKVAEKIAASLQELLPERDWKHTDLARELWGTAGANEAPRNTGTARRWVLADLPIPNEEAAGYIAQVLDIPISRLMEPKGRFNPQPELIRPRSDSKRFPSGNKAAKKKAKAAAKPKEDMRGKWARPKSKSSKTPGGRDREKQRAYNAAYRARRRAGKEKRKYTKPNGHDTGARSWILADGVNPPEYTIKSAAEGPPGHVSFTLNAVLPHERAMAILHMLQTGEESQ